MSAVLVKVTDVFFSTGIKWDNSPPYCGQLPALEETEPALY
jgi:hypothetical protein